LQRTIPLAIFTRKGTRFSSKLYLDNSKKIQQKRKQKSNIHKGLEFRKNIYKNNGFKGYEF
jgi:hypothetical protein